MNIKVVNVNAEKKKLFKYWLEFLKPYHKLRQKEIECLSLIMFYEHQLSEQIPEPELVQQLLFSSKTKDQIKQDLGGMDSRVFNNLLSSLRTKKVLGKDNVINKNLRAPIGPNGFQLIFNFIINESKDNKEGETGNDQDS